MNRFHQWLQAIGAIAVITGVVLVLLQLQQNENLLRLQLASDVRINRDADRNNTRGEEYSETLARLQMSPESLSDAEIVRVHAHIRSLVSELTLRELLQREEIFLGDWKAWLLGETCELMDNPLGRQWLEYHVDRIWPSTLQELERRLSECDPTFLQQIRLNAKAQLENEHERFAAAYAAAWSSQNPARLAAFYAPDGLLSVNDSDPAVGRAAIEAKAASFMTSFPDMLVTLERLEGEGNTLIFHWRWTGTHTGSGGNGAKVDLRGYEEWTLGEDGLIVQSLGNYDEGEYQRQLEQGDSGS